MAVKAIPDGYTPLTPYLYVRCSAEAIDFYAKAFGATEVMRLTTPDGGICHAEIDIRGAKLMLSDENAQWGNKSPLTLGGPSSGFALYVDDVDAAFAQAVAAGATVKMTVTDQFYGDRSGSIIDPFGHSWMLATHKEDVPVTEMQARMDAWMKTQAAPCQEPADAQAPATTAA